MRFHKHFEVLSALLKIEQLNSTLCHKENFMRGFNLEVCMDRQTELVHLC